MNAGANGGAEGWPAATGPVSALHVTREARRRHDLPPARFGLYGHVLELDATAASEWATRLRTSANELVAAVALHELMHALIRAVSELEERPSAAERSRARLARALGADAVRQLAKRFEEAFEAADPAGTAEPAPSETAAISTALEELLLLELARRNPALRPLRELFEAPAFATGTGYQEAWEAVEFEFGAAAAPAESSGGGSDPRTEAPRDDARRRVAMPGSLLDLLLEPSRRAPGSLLAQLREALALWRPLLGEKYGALLSRALRASDRLAEEQNRSGMGGGPPPVPDPVLALQVEGPVAFTADAPWMKGVALVAKSTFVWLAQLSQRYGRRVERLDEVPDDALAELREDGFNALWLIGIWRRSPASRTIKRLRGQPDAVASAYSIYDYEVAPELGGEEALTRLAERAARQGLRLASDMVPNHTAIDGRWVLEHPERFVQAGTPPYPGYRFGGPDLSTDPRVTLRLEDGYYDGSDAAVVFQRVDNGTGETSFVYHGNDGTALPWNDTAQLDYLREDVRRAVIDVTVQVARRFPIIRLDAAMTLARRHVRRLWHPAPGEGGAIPSRSELAISQAEFDRRMPREFWRELVERLAQEAPGTMLLAEAFWLMEVYFVRTLGMNRVYNSAFMHMTLAEENAEHRAYLKRFLEEPRVLERFVNFMSNPDEEPVAEQFGDGDKAFGVSILMATLPGLPMFGHGQVEGLREKYGMEFARPRTDEEPRAWHVERHRREVAPLLRRRELFAGAQLFRLFDLVAGDGGVVDDAFVYVNGSGDARALVAYNNGPRRVSGRVLTSAPFTGAGGEVASQSVAGALGIDASPGNDVVLEAHTGGAELRVDASELAQRGLQLTLEPYQALVFVGVRQERRAGEVEEAAVGVPLAGASRASRRAQAVLLSGRRGAAARRRARRRRR